MYTIAYIIYNFYRVSKNIRNSKETTIVVQIKNIENSMLDELVVTDTIPLRSEAKTSGRISQLSVAGMLAESIRRIAEGESLSSMFLD